MKPHAWRDLYATNLATIQASHAAARPLRLARPTILPRPHGMPAMTRASRSTGEQPGGDGTWQRFSHTGAGGSRAYFVYEPSGVAARGPVPLVVMLHGCTQSAADLARSTKMNEVADRHGFVVAYPQQSGQHNGQGCWNWFLPAHQQRAVGEPAVIAGIAQAVAAGGSETPIDPERIFLAGMSAGGAMAAILAANYPELFAGLAVHSGLPYAAATSQEAAFRAMARGARKGNGHAETLAAMGERRRPMPTIVIHGTSDSIVSPVNGARLVEQWLGANTLAPHESLDGELSRPSEVVREQVTGGHAHTRSRWSDARGRSAVEYLEVAGLGHAWSGGAAGAAWSDARGPDASEAIWRFFGELP